MPISAEVAAGGRAGSRGPAARCFSGTDGATNLARPLGVPPGGPGRDRHHRLDPGHPGRDRRRGVAAVPPAVGGAAVVRTSAAAPPVSAEALGVDEYREIAYAVSEDGVLQFTPLRVAGTYPPIVVPGLDGAADHRGCAERPPGAIRSVRPTAGSIPLEVRFKVEFKDGRAVLTPEHEFGAPVCARPREEAPDRRPDECGAPGRGPSSSPRWARPTLVVHTRRREEGARSARSRREALAAAVDGRGRRAGHRAAGRRARPGPVPRDRARPARPLRPARFGRTPPRGRVIGRHGADHGAPVPQRRSHARGRRPGRRGLDVAGRSAASRRRAAADARSTSSRPRRRGRRGQPVAPGQGVRHRRRARAPST